MKIDVLNSIEDKLGKRQFNSILNIIKFLETSSE